MYGQPLVIESTAGARLLLIMLCQTSSGILAVLMCQMRQILHLYVFGLTFQIILDSLYGSIFSVLSQLLSNSTCLYSVRQEQGRLQ